MRLSLHKWIIGKEQMKIQFEYHSMVIVSGYVRVKGKRVIGFVQHYVVSEQV